MNDNKLLHPSVVSSLLKAIGQLYKPSDRSFILLGRYAITMDFLGPVSES